MTLWERRLSYSWRAGNLLARSSLEAVHSPTETMAKETNLTFESSGGELDYGRTTWRDGRVALKAGSLNVLGFLGACLQFRCVWD